MFLTDFELHDSFFILHVRHLDNECNWGLDLPLSLIDPRIPLHKEPAMSRVLARDAMRLVDKA